MTNNEEPPPSKFSNGHKPETDVDRVLFKSVGRLKLLLPNITPRSLLIFIALSLVLLTIWTSLYTVPSDSVAVVQRFGKYVHDVPPGLHWKFPWRIDSATIVPVKRQLKQEFGFSTPGATDPYQTPRLVNLHLILTLGGCGRFLGLIF
ncbi:hypothetical protein KO489_14065 [Reinekea forsetii]|nr:hypothetical protein [Reinekea forsetii]